MPVSLVYINCSDRDEAIRIGRALVEAQLAASVNVIPEISSIYRWQNEVHDRSEAMLIVKTRPALVDEIIEVARAMHSYECPAILAVRADGGSPDYLDWVERETGGGA